ncbi:MAG: N-formylglutamate amidohydrolase [Bacteroidota bacterium]|nr:N-formylglutamate amidohydrolase [Bacteroidota bacterium]
MSQLIISCEHGGNIIPKKYHDLFKGADEVLNSHRGWDPGALKLAKSLHDNLKAPLFYSTTSRLLIELNRSLHHPSLFSSYTTLLKSKIKEEIVHGHYLPYRNEVEEQIKNMSRNGRFVIHLSIHSFTPVLNETVRNCEIGLLYDPGRKTEKVFCTSWKKNLSKVTPNWRVRMNYPYKGTADGFTTYLRKKFKDGYAGIELEVNQALFLKDQEQVENKILKSLELL